MTKDLCLICGNLAEDRHHPTGRISGEGSRYLDPDFGGPLCHDDHELVSDDEKRLIALEADLTIRSTNLDHLEVRLRRLAAFGARWAEGLTAGVLQTFVASVARHLEDWANQLARAIDGLDQAHPDWRTLPEVNG